MKQLSNSELQEAINNSFGLFDASKRPATFLQRLEQHIDALLTEQLRRAMVDNSVEISIGNSWEGTLFDARVRAQQSEIQEYSEPPWIEWNANPESDCPVPEGHDVEVKLANGSKYRDQTPEQWNWSDVGTDAQRYPENTAIVQYRDWTEWEQNQ